MLLPSRPWQAEQTMALVFPASALPSAIAGEDMAATTDSARANFFMAFQLLSLNYCPELTRVTRKRGKIQIM